MTGTWNYTPAQMVATYLNNQGIDADDVTQGDLNDAFRALKLGIDGDTDTFINTVKCRMRQLAANLATKRIDPAIKVGKNSYGVRATA